MCWLRRQACCQASCVTLGQHLNQCKPPFPHLYNGETDTYLLELFCGLNVMTVTLLCILSFHGSCGHDYYYYYYCTSIAFPDGSAGIQASWPADSTFSSILEQTLELSLSGEAPA